MKYVTYLVTYSGDKLPKYYIGSTSKEKANSGKYFGSICSNKYKEIFLNEKKYNIHLFKIKILSTHLNRKDAVSEELKLQIKYNVVNSNNYMNESLASVNGFFGRDVSGKNHPMYGKKHSEKTRNKLKIARSKRIITEETKRKMSESSKGRKLSDEHKRKLSESNQGLKRSDKTKKKISESKIGSTPWNKGLIKDIILQLDMDNNIIKEWYSLIELEEYGYQKSNAINVCNGKRKSHKGYRWIYKSEFNN